MITRRQGDTFTNEVKPAVPESFQPEWPKGCSGPFVTADNSRGIRFMLRRNPGLSPSITPHCHPRASGGRQITLNKSFPAAFPRIYSWGYSSNTHGPPHHQGLGPSFGEFLLVDVGAEHVQAKVRRRGTAKGARTRPFHVNFIVGCYGAPAGCDATAFVVMLVILSKLIALPDLPPLMLPTPTMVTDLSM